MQPTEFFEEFANLLFSENFIELSDIDYFVGECEESRGEYCKDAPEYTVKLVIMGWFKDEDIKNNALSLLESFVKEKNDETAPLTEEPINEYKATVVLSRAAMKLWCWLNQKNLGRPIPTDLIAEKYDLSTALTKELLKELHEEGLIKYTPSGVIVL